MCYHISLTKEKNTIEAKLKASYNAPLAYEPYYHFNGWEMKNLSIIKQNDESFIDLALWGVLPTSFDVSKRNDFLSKTNTLNATSERLFTSNLYNQFIKTQKCIILADGFIEPHSSSLGEKIPFYFKEKNHNIIAFAGIYSVVENQEASPTYSASIITTEANPFFKEIHNKPNSKGSYRMPLILDPTDYEYWLNTEKEVEIKTLLHRFTRQEIISYPVSKNLFTNKVDSNTPNILKKVEFQRGLF